MHCMMTPLLLLFPFYSHDILPLLDQQWVTGGEETRRQKHALSLYSSFPWYDYRSTCNLLGSRWRSDGSLLSCSDTRDNKEETTLLSAFPTLKISSGPEHDSRQQQIDTQNTGILARRMDCGQEPEVGNKYLSHPVKHLQVAFKRGGQRGYSVSAGKVLDVDWLDLKKHRELMDEYYLCSTNISKPALFREERFYESVACTKISFLKISRTVQSDGRHFFLTLYCIQNQQ